MSGAPQEAFFRLAGLKRARSVLRRSPLAGMCAAAGLALSLTACGGGGGGIGASGFGGPGGPAVSLAPGAGVPAAPSQPPAAPETNAPAPAAPPAAAPPQPVSEPESAPASATAPQTPVVRPDPPAPTPNAPPAGFRTTLPPTPNPETAQQATGASVPTARPANFLSGDGETLTLNNTNPNVGTQGQPGYKEDVLPTFVHGSDVQVQWRSQRWENCFSCNWEFNNSQWFVDGYLVPVEHLWLTYPHNAAADATQAHVRAIRTRHGDKMALIQAVQRARRGHLPDFVDHFLVEAHYQVKDATLPTGTNGTSATWNGKTIAFDNRASVEFYRGLEIGGDAKVVVNFASSGHKVAVTLSNLKMSHTHQVDTPVTFSNISWSNLSLSTSNSGGVHFEQTTGNTIEGAFGGTNAANVAGKYNVPGKMTGSFQATK